MPQGSTFEHYRSSAAALCEARLDLTYCSAFCREALDETSWESSAGPECSALHCEDQTELLGCKIALIMDPCYFLMVRFSVPKYPA